MTEKALRSDVFRQAALQNADVASTLSKLAERARKKLETDWGKAVPGATTRRRERSASSPVSRDINVGVFSDSSVVLRQEGYHHYDSTGYRHAKATRARRSIVPLVALLLLVSGAVVLGIILGRPLLWVLIAHWESVLMAVGGILVGAGVILAIRHIGASPLRDVQAPDDQTDEPLRELEGLAKRSVSRLMTAWRMQVGLVCGVALTLLAIIVWSIVMVTKGALVYATAFGSTGVGMLVLSQWKWQPFERVAQARKLADDADILATALRLRIVTISEIADPKERSQAQWQAVTEYLKTS